jgi:alkylation response protein AidB-like acyl-CoA dehydrogenase
VLADCKAKAVIARVFVNDCIDKVLRGALDLTTSAIAKLWVTEAHGELVDACLQLHGGYGYINDYPIARMWRDARVQRIYGGSSEIMKLLIARSL